MAVIGGNLAFGIQWRHFTTSRDSNVDVMSTTSFFILFKIPFIQFTCNWTCNNNGDSLISFSAINLNVKSSVVFLWLTKKTFLLFSILYWIRLISRIKWIQLESVKRNWRLPKAFLCLILTVDSLGEINHRNVSSFTIQEFTTMSYLDHDLWCRQNF